MKKNKRLQYVLVGLVVLIWGTLAYQMINWQGGERAYSIPEKNYLSLQIDSTQQRDSFVVVGKYRDPFLEGSFYNSGTKKTSKTSNSKSKYHREAPPPLNGKGKPKQPKIAYWGYSINDNEITRVRISINNQIHTLKVNDQADKLIVHEMHKDHVLISWAGEKKVIKKEKDY